MKIFKLLSVSGILTSLLLSSCSIDKKIYFIGYHIEWNGKKNTSQNFSSSQNFDEEQVKSSTKFTTSLIDEERPLKIEKCRLKNELINCNPLNTTCSKKFNRTTISNSKEIEHSLSTPTNRKPQDIFKSNKQKFRSLIGRTISYSKIQTYALFSRSDFWEDFLGVLFFIGIILLELGLIFFGAWGLVAIFPTMSYWFAVPLAIVFWVVLFFLLYILAHPI